eukprot:UC4_evm4s22
MAPPDPRDDADDVRDAKLMAGLTSDERRSINIFQNSQASVVAVNNMATVAGGFFNSNPTEVPQGAGSGFIWDSKGHVVTNFHVVQGADDVTVTLAGNSEPLPARVVGVDADRDVAVLKLLNLEEGGIHISPLPIGTSSSLVVGQKTYAIGNPFGLDHTLTTGIVSALGRELKGRTGRPISNCIQTDASINPGNSGGRKSNIYGSSLPSKPALLNSAGEVIGVNTAIFSPSGASAGIGFAIPIDLVGLSVSQIIKYGRPVRPSLGITLAPDGVLKRLGVEGALVYQVHRRGAARELRETYYDRNRNLVLGDVITHVNDIKIRNTTDLLKAIEFCTVGETIVLGLLRFEGTRRGGRPRFSEVQVKITLQDLSNLQSRL